MSTNRDGAAAEAGIVTELSGSNLDGTKAAAPKLQPAGGLFGLAALSALSAKPARKFAPAAAARRKPGATGPAPAPAPSAPAPGPAAGSTALEGGSDVSAAAAGSGAGMGAGGGVGSGAGNEAGSAGASQTAASAPDVLTPVSPNQPLLTNDTHSHISNTAAAAEAGTAAGSRAAPLAPLPQQAPAPAAASGAPPASGPGPPTGSNPSSSKQSGAGPAATTSTVSRDQPSSCLLDLTSLGNKGRPVAELPAGGSTQGKTSRELPAQQASAPDHSAEVSDGAGRALDAPAERLAAADVLEQPDLTPAVPQPQPRPQPQPLQAIPTAPMVASEPPQQHQWDQQDQQDQREPAALDTPEQQQQQQQEPLSLPLQQEQSQQEEHEARQQQLRQQRAAQQQLSLMALTAKTQDPLLLELLQEQLQRLSDAPPAPSPPPHPSQDHAPRPGGRAEAAVDDAPSPGGRAEAAVGPGVGSTAGPGEVGGGGAGSGAVAAAAAGAAAAGVPSGQEGAGAGAVGEGGSRGVAGACGGGGAGEGEGAGARPGEREGAGAGGGVMAGAQARQAGEMRSPTEEKVAVQPKRRGRQSRSSVDVATAAAAAAAAGGALLGPRTRTRSGAQAAVAAPQAAPTTDPGQAGLGCNDAAAGADAGAGAGAVAVAAGVGAAGTSRGASLANEEVMGGGPEDMAVQDMAPDAHEPDREAVAGPRAAAQQLPATDGNAARGGRARGRGRGRGGRAGAGRQAGHQGQPPPHRAVEQSGAKATAVGGAGTGAGAGVGVEAGAAKEAGAVAKGGEGAVADTAGEEGRVREGAGEGKNGWAQLLELAASAVQQREALKAADSAPKSSRRTKRPAADTNSAEVAAAQAADLGLKTAAGAAVGKPGKRMARPKSGSQATANTEGSSGPKGEVLKEGTAGKALRPRRSAASAVATLPSSSSSSSRRRKAAAAGRSGAGSGSDVATDGKSERSEGSEVSESEESEAGSEEESDDESEEKEGNGKRSSKGAKQVKRRRAANKPKSPEELNAALLRRKTSPRAGEGGGKRRRGPLTPEEELERKRTRLEALRAHTRMMIDQISITPALKQQAHDFVTRICGLRRVLAPAGPAPACEPAAGARIEARPDDEPLRRELGPTGSAGDGGPAEATGCTAGAENSLSPVGSSLAMVAGTSGELSAARDEVDELLEVAKAEQQILSLTKALESCKPGAVARVLQLPGHLRSPQGDRERPVDLKTWSLKRIIARTQAWDRAKDAEVRAARELAQEQAAARMLLERGAAERGEAGQGALEQLDEDDQAALLPGYQPRSRGGAQAAAEVPEEGEGREGGGEGLMAPRVQVTADGRLVVDESSLTMQAQRVELASYERVEEGVTRTLNSASYTKRAQSERWDAEETALFYRALKAFGTDFAMIAQLYPYRTRLSIKNKFNKEERENASQVHAAMKSSATDLADQRVLIDLVRQNMASPPAAGARPPKPGGRGRGKPGARGGGRAPARLHASPSPDANGSPTQEAVGTDVAAAPQPAVRGDKGTAQRLQDQPPVVEGHQAARQTAPAPTANAVAAADKSSAAAQGLPKSTPQDASGAAALRGAAQPPAHPSQPRGLRDVAPPAAPAQQSAGAPQATEAPKEAQQPQPAIAQPDPALNEAAQPAPALAKEGAEPRQASGPSALPALGFMGLPGGLGELQSRTRKVAPSLVRRGVTAPRPSAPRNPRPSAAAPDVAPGPASAPAVTQPPAPAPEPTTGAAEEAGVPHEEDEEMMYNY